MDDRAEEGESGPPNGELRDDASAPSKVARAVWPRAAGGGAGGVAARRACASDWAPGARDAALRAFLPLDTLPPAERNNAVPPPLPPALAAGALEEPAADPGALEEPAADPSAFEEAAADPSAFEEVAAGPSAFEEPVVAERCAPSTVAADANVVDPLSSAVDTIALPPSALWRAAAEERSADARAHNTAGAAAIAAGAGLGVAAPEAAHWTARFPAEVPTPRAAPAAAAPPRPYLDFEGDEPVPSSRLLHAVLRIGGGLAASAAVLLLGLILLYRFVDPPISMLMLIQRLGGTAIHQRWVPLARIAPVLPQAVIASEDARFCYHRGVDWGELAEAIESSREGMARGGSTITMQVVKNLFLWPSRSYVRKALEIPLAYAVELLWPKRRILEVYLNVAEWGPGIFGAETAALYHFRKPAALLTLREAALLAVSLPNPVERQAGRPGPGLLRLANRLAARMRVEAGSACLHAPR